MLKLTVVTSQVTEYLMRGIKPINSLEKDFYINHERLNKLMDVSDTKKIASIITRQTEILNEYISFFNNLKTKCKTTNSDYTAISSSLNKTKALEILAVLWEYLNDKKKRLAKGEPLSSKELNPVQIYLVEEKYLQQFKECIASAIVNTSKDIKENKDYLAAIKKATGMWSKLILVPMIMLIMLAVSNKSFSQEMYSTKVPERLALSSLLAPDNFEEYQKVLFENSTNRCVCNLQDKSKNTHAIVFNKGFYEGSFAYTIDGTPRSMAIPKGYILNIYKLIFEKRGDMIAFNLYVMQKDGEYSIGGKFFTVLTPDGTELSVDRTPLSKLSSEE